MRAHVTQETLSIEAQSADVVTPTSSICNAEGERFLRSPEGPVPGRPQGVVAGSLCAEGTPPRPRLALWPARHRRGHAFSVNRPLFLYSAHAHHRRPPQELRARRTRRARVGSRPAEPVRSMV